MRRARSLLAAVLVLSFAACEGPASGPDAGELASRVNEQQLRSHVEALASAPRNGVAQPERAAEAAAYVERRLRDAGLAVRRQDVRFQGVSLPNVIGEKRGGVCPERIFILGAHYDSQPGTPGADDNASGVAGVLSAAEALAKADLPASVWFVGFSFEEEGLVGSATMARALEDQGVEVAGMVALEMIGYTSPGLDATGGPGDAILVVADPASESLARAFESAAAEWTPDLTTRVLVLDPATTPDIRRSDHAPFWNMGSRALMLTDGANLRNPHYHQPGDSADTLDFTFMARVTRAAIAGTWSYLTADAGDDGIPDVCAEG
jgi:hypothetical protein